MSHTPGPWVVDVERAKGRRGKKGPATMLMVVAEAGGMPGLIVNQPPIVEPRDVANANLIAAAPDLLAELERLVRALGPKEETGLDLPGIATLNAARLAIKKARGE